MQRKTPIMGWASWNCFRTDINEERIKQQADELVKRGLAECGYTYLNTDDGFFGGRGKDGELKFHSERFPNGIKPIADYAHKLGLKAGIYSDGGDKTCGFYYDNEGENGNDVGLYGHEEQDLKLYLEDFGFDFIKVDWCGGVRLGLDEQEQYSKIGRIIDEIRRKTVRQIIYNICRWQFPGAWAADVADSWRTGADITPCFDSVLHQLDVVKPLASYCSPGHVNDLDMLQLGNGMSFDEEMSHFAMWCMMSTPLMIGCDLTKIADETLEILKNKELIEINQDAACLQAFVIKEIRDESGNLLGEVWVKDLGEKNSNKKAVALLNRSNDDIEIGVDFGEVGLTGAVTSIRNLCRHTDEDAQTGLSARLRPHETAVYRVESEGSVCIEDRYDKADFEEKPLNKISIGEARDLIKNGAVLIDVRDKREYDKNHLEGAINIPYTDIHSTAGFFLKDKEIPVVVYCSTGKRSILSKKSLEYLGYKNVYYLGGVDVDSDIR